jgi:SpoVK/Ycf46/Vps4 family AAA+-type ATPase
LDEAARRRFVKRLYIPLPNRVAREELIKTVVRHETEKGNHYQIDDEV